MIEVVKNTALDNEKLSYILIPKSPDLQDFDFSKVSVRKPWGSEYLLYDDLKSSAWILHLNKDAMTSMHCHVYKKTALIVLSGEVVCSTLNEGFLLKNGDGLVLDRKVFHSTQVVGNGPAILLEVEFPSKKADVVRLADAYGRECSGYEAPSETNYESRDSNSKYFRCDELNSEKKVGNMFLSFMHLTDGTVINPSKEEDILVLFEGEAKDEINRQVFKSGDIMVRTDRVLFTISKRSKILKISSKSSPSLRAVLFDFDGVLADTMEDNYNAWKKACFDYGITLKREDYFPFEGIQLPTIAKMICEKYSLNNVPFEEIVEKKETYYRKEHTLKLYPGVVEIVDKLRERGILTAIVSAGRRQRLESSVPKEFLGRFNAIITGDSIERGKPYPDPYIEAMKSLNVSPHEAIVVENAPSGIESAKSARCYCIAIASTLDKNFLNSADVIIDNFSELANTEMLKSIIV